jgi:hypothetical protein
MSLLPEGEANLAKLQSIVAKSKEKLVNLRLQWEEHKASLEHEYNDLLRKIDEQQVRKSNAGFNSIAVPHPPPFLPTLIKGYCL